MFTSDRLPIPHQLKYIRAALSAGKTVLSEKPAAKSAEDARQLIAWYRSSVCIGHWSVSENWRFLNSVNRAQEEVSKLGRVVGFSVQVRDPIHPGSKFFGERRTACFIFRF
jgi:predicted dehydrogenase